MNGFNQQPENILTLRGRAEEVLRRRRKVLHADIVRERIRVRNEIDHEAQDEEEYRDDQTQLQTEARVFPKPFHVLHSSFLSYTGYADR